jgi:hypothetical protein
MGDQHLAETLCMRFNPEKKEPSEATETMVQKFVHRVTRAEAIPKFKKKIALSIYKALFAAAARFL